MNGETNIHDRNVIIMFLIKVSESQISHLVNIGVILSKVLTMPSFSKAKM